MNKVKNIQVSSNYFSLLYLSIVLLLIIVTISVILIIFSSSIYATAEISNTNSKLITSVTVSKPVTSEEPEPETLKPPEPVSKPVTSEEPEPETLKPPEPVSKPVTSEEPKFVTSELEQPVPNIPVIKSIRFLVRANIIALIIDQFPRLAEINLSTINKLKKIRDTTNTTNLWMFLEVPFELELIDQFIKYNESLRFNYISFEKYPHFTFYIPADASLAIEIKEHYPEVYIDLYNLSKSKNTRTDISIPFNEKRYQILEYIERTILKLRLE